MDEITMHESPAGHIDRREALRRGAFVVGAATLWATPVVQTLGMRPAAAASHPTADFCPHGDSAVPVALVLRYSPVGGCQGATALEACTGGLTDGDGPVNITVTRGQAGSSVVRCVTEVAPGDTLLIEARNFGGRLNPRLTLEAVSEYGTSQTVTFHTSCSQPLDIGDRFGSFVLVAGKDDAGNVEGSLSASQTISADGPCAQPTSQAAGEKAEQEKAEKEKAEKDEKTEKEKAEKEKAEKDEKTEQDKAAEEKAEKEKAEKDGKDEKTEQDKAAEEKAEQEKAEKAEQEKVAEEKAEQEKAEKEKAEKAAEEAE